MINVLSICNAHLLFSIIPSIRPTDDIWPLHLLDLSDDNHVSASYGIYLYQPTADIYLFMLKIAHPSHYNQHNTLHCILPKVGCDIQALETQSCYPQVLSGQLCNAIGA